MEIRKSFIVVEDEEPICEEYRTKAKERKSLFLLDTTNDSLNAVKLVCEYTPDAVVLDIELNKGSGTGIEFLENLKAVEADKKPLILVVTNITSTMVHHRIHELGGDLIITKDKPDYSVDFVLNTLESLASPASINNSRQAEAAKAIAKAEYTKKRKNRIAAELELIGIRPNLKGFTYLCDAIELTCDGHPDSVSRIIAEEYNVTADSADKAMRNAITSAWNRDRDNFLMRYTAYINKERGLPTMMEFISYYARKVDKEL